MFFALDKNNNRVNAEDGVFYDCICPACKKPVRQRRGEINRHHFAHLQKESSCPFEYNKDYVHMSEWHIRMQEYFPKDSREIIFTDEETGEKHIADVFLKESNTVLEFQYSHISKQEFLDRTNFHLKEHRRIVWLFYEGWKEDTSSSKMYPNGKLVHTMKRSFYPYSSKTYKWIYRRKFVEDGPDINQPNYSVCLYTDTEGDVFHKLISLNEERIIVSLHDITMSDNLDTEEFFYSEDYWKEQEPWKSAFEIITEEQQHIVNSTPLSGKWDRIESSEEYKRRYLAYEDISIRISKELREKKEASINMERAMRKGVCPLCGGHLIIRNGKYGQFYGCSNYPRCKFTHKV